MNWTKLELIKLDAEKCYGEDKSLVVTIKYLDEDKARNVEYKGKSLREFIDTTLHGWYDNYLRCKIIPAVIIGWRC